MREGRRNVQVSEPTLSPAVRQLPQSPRPSVFAVGVGQACILSSRLHLCARGKAASPFVPLATLLLVSSSNFCNCLSTCLSIKIKAPQVQFLIAASKISLHSPELPLDRPVQMAPVFCQVLFSDDEVTLSALIAVGNVTMPNEKAHLQVPFFTIYSSSSLGISFSRDTTRSRLASSLNK